MSIDQIAVRSSVSRRRRRPLLFVTAGLIAAVLSVGGPLAASAAPLPAFLPVVTLSATTVSVSGRIHLTGAGFASNENIAVMLDATAANTNTPVSTDNMGDLQTLGGDVTVYLPDNITLGAHTITVTGASSNVPVTKNITVVPAPVSTPAGVTRTISQFMTGGVTASFAGFTPGDSVQFGLGTGAMGNTIGAPVTVAPDGTVSITFNFGDAFPGGTAAAIPYTLRAINTTDSFYSQFVTITVVADPVIPVTPVAVVPVTPATPATPVRGTASFTG